MGLRVLKSPGSFLVGKAIRSIEKQDGKPVVTRTYRGLSEVSRSELFMTGKERCFEISVLRSVLINLLGSRHSSRESIESSMSHRVRRSSESTPQFP